MDLKGRLSRLRPGAPLSPAERVRQTEPNPSLRQHPAVEPVSGIDPIASIPPDRASTIETLREKMDAILGRAPSVSATRVAFDPATSALPFARLATGEGMVCQRVQTQRLSERVGRIPLVSAADSDPEMLSLLALDPALTSCEPRRALYLDTETTGLGGAGTVAFLVGLGWFDERDHFVLEQLLLETPAQEPALFARLRELVERASMLVTFNGKSFDWPLLEGRCVMNRLAALPKRPHLDLLHVARRVHKHRLERCRLIHLEAEVLGWQRGDDDIPGAEIAPRYGHFLRTGDDEALRPVIEHNAWDVLSMAALVGLYGEPFEALCASDLVGATRAFTRAKAFHHAERAADRALQQGEGVAALDARARLFKARGDKARALVDFAKLSLEVDDPRVRLELVKLYEHHEKDFERALHLLDAGTGEDAEATQKRRARLSERAARKARQAPKRPL